MDTDAEDICGAETAQGTPCEHPPGDNGRCWLPSHNPDGEGQSVGRDPKLTKERQEQIASDIEAGKSIRSACRMAGISKASFYNWMDRGEDEEETIYGDFFDRIVRARGHGEDRYFRTIFDIAREEGDLATLMSMLKQRYPESWGEVDRGEQTGGVVVNVGDSQEYEVDPDTLEVTER